MPTRFRPNRQAFTHLTKEPQFKRGMEGFARKVEERAKEAAPTFTGHYAKSFTVVWDGERWLVGNTDIAAHLIEFGSVNNPAFAPLRRGATAAGLRLSQHQ